MARLSSLFLAAAAFLTVAAAQQETFTYTIIGTSRTVIIPGTTRTFIVTPPPAPVTSSSATTTAVDEQTMLPPIDPTETVAPTTQVVVPGTVEGETTAPLQSANPTEPAVTEEIVNGTQPTDVSTPNAAHGRNAIASGIAIAAAAGLFLGAF